MIKDCMNVQSVSGDDLVPALPHRGGGGPHDAPRVPGGAARHEGGEGELQAGRQSPALLHLRPLPPSSAPTLDTQRPTGDRRELTVYFVCSEYTKIIAITWSNM